MRINCPFCGERDISEFSYLGDADSAKAIASAAQSEREQIDAVYLRANPAGVHRELWYHAFGCGSWLNVTRDTRTHEIFAVQLSRERTP